MEPLEKQTTKWKNHFLTLLITKWMGFVRVSLKIIWRKYKATQIFEMPLLVNYLQEKVWASSILKECISVEVLLYSLLTCHPQAKEKQEELAMDMKILEKLLDDTRNEVKEETQRKVCSCLKWWINVCISLHWTCTCTKCTGLQEDNTR